MFVDNTMFNGVPGLWRAWLVDQEGQKIKCGVIPSKYKVEEELLMKRSLADNTGENGSRAATSARRSFFRRRKNNHQRSSSRESTKELASFSDVSINSFSDSGAITAENDYNYQLLPNTYLRVERLSYKTTRPVIIIGPLQEVLSIKLEQDFQQTFKRCVPEIMKGSQQMMERWLQDLKLVDYRRDYRGSQGSHFECITVAAVREICDKVSPLLTMALLFASHPISLPAESSRTARGQSDFSGTTEQMSNISGGRLLEVQVDQTD